MTSLLGEAIDHGDNFAIQAFRRAFRGALFGASVGITAAIMNPRSPFARRLISQSFSTLNEQFRYASLTSLQLRMLRPAAASGAFGGLLYYFVHDMLSPKLFSTNEHIRYRASHAAFTALLCVCLWNPVFIIRSSLLGLLLGDVMYLRDFGLDERKTQKNGFSIFSPDATEADRINTKNHQQLIGHGMEFHDGYTLTPNWRSV